MIDMNQQITGGMKDYSDIQTFHSMEAKAKKSKTPIKLRMSPAKASSPIKYDDSPSMAFANVTWGKNQD